MPVFVVLLIAGVVEISVLVVVGQAIGVLPTIGLLAASAVLGAWLLRREGRRTLQEFSEAARLRRPPERELSDGVLIVLGGLLILLPGLVGDVVGLLFLLPPTRAVLRRRLQRTAERRSRAMHERLRAQARAASAGTYRGRQAGTGTDDVIDGEVVSVTEDDEADGKSGGATHLPPPRSSGSEEPPRG
ncbi:UPF0716 protein FxsA [Halopolyspora algeriensis]|uniref:UPF0716 protein FxsA n=1 Tax=Halopolyspora algeriensis TaxID=1500506 RepID=A0A368VJT7_9ACTN|nr:FxsA family protein [Halopolyspora algeriensis]RCW40496.1 UPF0716 protein FxsA [Halopolyspora algeriensis]TQM53779.1 UPF0716 protein FxsA [Halopolyspora algeriensis]